jgi:predicted amidohydrolase YtcJ
VALRRGGHVMVANSAALELAGITSDTPDPQRGTIVRDASGRPTGVLVERPAFEPVSRLLPEPSFDEQVDQLGRACRAYNARGITAVRDPGLSGAEFRIYQEAADAGMLTVRSRVMLRMFPEWSADQMIEEIDRWRVRTGLGDDTLRLGGVKIFLDGGVEGAALSEPYADDPTNYGHLFLEDAALTHVVEAAVSRGWEVGCHALGDRAVAQALDAFEAARRACPRLRDGHLVLEHACFADAPTRKRAVRLGLGVCVQHPLVSFLGGNMVKFWGEERTERAFPIRSWVEDGALVSAGSDHNITFLDPLRSIWGMVTRGTASAGVRGAAEAIDRRTAFELSTVAGARLVDDRRLGPLAPGRHADLVAFRDDPLACPIDDLPELEPSVTMMGGRPVHDPEGRFDG